MLRILRKLIQEEPVLPLFAVARPPCPPAIQKTHTDNRQPQDPALHRIELGFGPTSVFVTVR